MRRKILMLTAVLMVALQTGCSASNEQNAMAPTEVVKTQEDSSASQAESQAASVESENNKSSDAQEAEQKEKEIAAKQAEVEATRKEREAAEAAAKAEQEEKALIKEIRLWQIRKLGLITDYPVLVAGSKSDENKFYLRFGYDLDNYADWYTLQMEGDTCTIELHEMYDGKVGEVYTVDTNVGNSYDLPITEEVRNEYTKFSEKQAELDEYAKMFDQYLKSTESRIYKEFTRRECYLEEYTEEGNLTGIFEYWQIGNSSFKGLITFKVNVNAATDEMSFVEIKENASQSYGIDYSEFNEPIILQ